MAKRYKVFRGDTFELTLPVTLNGAVYDITGCTLFFTVKNSINDLDTAALSQKKTGTGITHTSPTSGIANLVVPSTETELWPLNKALPYDVQLKTTANEIFTIETGFITVRPEVTRITS